MPPRLRVPRLLGVCLAASALAVLAAPDPARAQSQDEAAARALFNDGRRLVKAGDYEQACGKFEAARKLVATAGVLLNLADCHEKIHRTASAWAEFGDAADAAARAGRPGDEEEAKKRQAALQDKLSLLSIRADGATDDEVVRRDGTVIDRSALGTAIPVDPGKHTVTAEAPGRRPWTTTFEVSEPGKTRTVTVPRLDESAPVAKAPAATEGAAARAPDAALESVPAPTVPDRSSTGSGQRIAGWTVGGVGVATMAAGGVMALVARSEYTNAVNEGVGRHDDSVKAVQLADAATVVLAVGGAATVTGIVVLLTAPKAPVSVGTTGTSVVVSGRF